MTDELDDLAASLAQKDNATIAVHGALNRSWGFNPDEYAKSMRVAAATGVTPKAVLRDPKDYEKAARSREVNPEDLVTLSPRTAQWLVANDDNAAIAHDDLINLQSIEQASRQIHALTPWQQFSDKYISPVVRTAQSYPLTRFAIGTVGGSVGMLGDIGAFAGWHGDGRSGRNALQQFQHALDPSVTGANTSLQSQHLPFDAIAQNVGPLIPTMLASGGTSALARILGLSKRGSEIAAGIGVGGLFTAQQGGATYTQARESGRSPEQARAMANKVAGINAPANLLFGLTPLSKTLHDNPFASSLVMGGLQGGSGQIAQNEVMDRPATEGLLGAMIHGAAFQGGLHAGMGYAGEFSKLLASAEASKLRERAPAQFHELVSSVLKDNPAENTFIPADQFSSYFQSKGFDPAHVAGQLGATNYVEALAAGTDVQIPTANFLTALAGTEHAKALLPDTKFSPESYTPRQLGEQADLLKAAQDGLQSQVETPAPDARQALRDGLVDQFTRLGYEPSTAETYADAFSSLLHNANVRMEDPTYADQWKLSFSRPIEGEAAMTPVDRVLARLKAAGVGGEANPMFQGEIPRGVHFKNLPREAQERVTRSIENEIDGWANNPESFFNAYDAHEETHGGQLVNGDIIYSMIPTVSKDLFQGHTAGESIDFAKMSHLKTLMRQQAQRAIDRAGDKPIAITAGGQASGKTTSANWLLNNEKVGAVIDAPHDRAENIEDILKLAKNVHKDADVYFVVRPDLKASEISNIKRAMREGRYVEPQWRGDTTAKVPGEILKVAENHHDDPRVGLHILINGEGVEPEIIGGKLSRDGKDVVSIIRDLETPSSEQLAKTASEAYDSYQKEASNGHPDFPALTDELRARIEAAHDRGMVQDARGEEVLAGSDRAPELGTQQGVPRTEQDAATSQVAQALRALGIDPAEVQTGSELLQRIDQAASQHPELADVARDLKAQLGSEYFQNDRAERARAAMRRSLSPSGQSAELTRRAEEARGEEDAFRAWEEEVKKVQVGDVHGGDNRGFIQFGPDHQVHIGLLEKADLSTLIHEFSGHFGLEMMRDMAERPNAPEQVKADYATIRADLGLADGDAIQTQHHEDFARKVERYFMEGKAPSEELRGTFGRIKEWMKLIYRKIEALGVKLKPEVREVFDRMFASDDAIQQARAEVGDMRPLITKPEDIGWDKATFDAYQKTLGKEIETASAATEHKLIAEAQRQHEDWWKAESAKVREEIAPAVDSRTDMRALRVLQDGKLEDGTPLKLDRADLVRVIGEDAAKQIRRSREAVYTREGGVDLETAAEILGFDSGRELAHALMTAPKRGELLDRLTDEIMKGRHGDMQTDGTLADAAMEAIHNQSREQRIAMELKALAAKAREVRDLTAPERRADKAAAREARDVPPMQTFRDAARSLVEGQAIKDLQPYRYLVAGRQESRKAYDSMAKNDYTAAAEAKQKELLNHFLYLEAVKAKGESEAIAKYGLRLAEKPAQARIGLAGGSFQDQVNAVLARYEFARVSNKELLERKQSLEAWIESNKVVNGEDTGIVDADPILYDERPKNWRECSIQELRTVRDVLKNIETVARNQKEYLLNGKQADFDSEKTSAIESAYANNKAKPVARAGTKFGIGEKAVRAVLSADAEMTKMEWLIDALDGGDINGAWRRNVKRPIDDATAKYHELSLEMAKQIKAAVEARPAAERRGELSESIGLRLPGMDRDMNRMQLISWALNLGTAENRNVALKGEGMIGPDGMPGPLVDQLLGSLRKTDCEFIQRVWDALGTTRETMIEVERRMTGLSPKLKELTPFQVTTADGETVQMRGGYYPLKADPSLSEVGKRQEDLFNQGNFGASRASTASGHTKEVSGATYHLMLDYQHILGPHLNDVVKRITHAEAVREIQKFIGDKEIRKTMQETIGEAAADEFLPWLQDCARSRRAETDSSWILRFLMSRRSGMVAARLAGNMGSYMVQTGDVYKTFTEIRPDQILAAQAQIALNPRETVRMIQDLSPNEMRYRDANFNREIKEMLESKSLFDEKKQAVTEFLMEGFKVMDSLTAYPAWLAKFNEGMSKHGIKDQAVAEADRMIARTMQAGESRNMSRIMRKEGWIKLFTTFQGDANTLYGIVSSAIHSGDPKRIAMGIMVVALDSMTGAWLKNRGPQDDENGAEWALERALLGLAGTVPVLGDAARYVDDKFNGRQSQFGSNPVMSAIELPFRAGSSLANDNKDATEKSQDVLEAAGIWAGIPGTAQAIRSWRYQHKVQKGEESPKNAAEATRDALLGPNHKK